MATFNVAGRTASGGAHFSCIHRHLVNMGGAPYITRHTGRRDTNGMNAARTRVTVWPKANLTHKNVSVAPTWPRLKRPEDVSDEGFRKLRKKGPHPRSLASFVLRLANVVEQVHKNVIKSSAARRPTTAGSSASTWLNGSPAPVAPLVLQRMSLRHHRPHERVPQTEALLLSGFSDSRPQRRMLPGGQQTEAPSRCKSGARIRSHDDGYETRSRR